MAAAVPASGAAAPVAAGEATSTRTIEKRPARDHARRLANLAAGSATALSLGGVVSAILAVLPLKPGQTEWQMTAISTLLSHGPWILVGLVLLHLACLLQPRDGALLQRLGTARRLATVTTLLFLLLSPLPPLLTWRSLAVARSGRERVITTSGDQLLAYRRAITDASGFADLKRRMAAIPGSAPLPEQLGQLPFSTVRQGLLTQLAQTEQRVQTRLRRLEGDPNHWEPWRKALQASFGCLMLALGFASGAQGLRGTRKLLGLGPVGGENRSSADQAPPPSRPFRLPLPLLATMPARQAPNKNQVARQRALQRTFQQLTRALSRLLFGKRHSKRRALLRGWRLPNARPGSRSSSQGSRERGGRRNKVRVPR